MITGIILSAGLSSRMKYPKALLEFNNKTFLEHIAENFLNSKIDEVIIVLGDISIFKEEYLNKIENLTKSKPIKIVVNKNYMLGMGESIKCGVINANENSDAYLIGLVDSVFVSPRLINELVDAFNCSKKNIVAPSYNNRRGHPVIIGKKYKYDLLNINADIGAREILNNNSYDIYYYNTDDSSVLININTIEDYQRYCKL